MSKARTLANLISDNAELADGQISVAEVVGAAPTASPTFTGNIGVAGNITNASGNLTLDVAGDIILDADGGDITLRDGGVDFGQIRNQSGDFVFQSGTSDKDIKFIGNDGGSDVTALTLDMSAAGAATFNSNVSLTGTLYVDNSTTNGFLSAGSNILNFGTTSNDTLAFYANNTNHMKLKPDGEVILNETGNAEGDLRVESDSNSHMLFVDAGQNKVGVNNSNPTATFDVIATGSRPGIYSRSPASQSAQTNSQLVLIDSDNANLRANFMVEDGTGSGSNGSMQIEVTEAGVSNDRDLRIQGSGKTFFGGYIGGPSRVNVAGTLAITDNAGGQSLLIGNQDSGGANNPFVISVGNGRATFGNGNSWSSSSGGTMTSHLSIGNGTVVVNEDGNDQDFRVESDDVSHMLFVDANNNRVGVAESSPQAPLHVRTNSGADNTVELLRLDCGSNVHQSGKGGKIQFTDIDVYTPTAEIIARREGVSGNSHLEFSLRNNVRLALTNQGRFTTTPVAGGHTVFNEGGVNAEFRVESDNNTHAFYVDGSNGAKYFGTGTNQGTTGAGTFNIVVDGGDAINLQHNVDGNHVINMQQIGATTSNFFYFSKNGGGRGSISVSTTGTTYNTTSDRRLKDNIEPIADATDKLMSMKPVTHTWIADPEAPSVHGFIAQEMQEIVPEAVSGEDGGEEMMSMDYGRITPVLVAALQEATNEIKALKQRVSELEAI